MRRSASLVPALAAAALLLTACGTVRAGSADSGPGAVTPPSGTQINDPGKDGVRVTSLSLGPTAPPATRGTSVHADPLPADAHLSAGYEVTNDGTEPLTYTVVFTFTDDSGGAILNQTATVRDVRPGKTVHGTVRAGTLLSAAPPVTGVKVLEVTKVPTAEAPAAPGTCPASGIRISVDRGDAAMGLRIVGLHLDNCGTRDYTVDGYPQLELLDDGLHPVKGVRILQGGSGITTGLGPDRPPRPVTLQPGHSTTAQLVWRNTTGFGTAVNAPYVRVRAKTGGTPVIVTPHLDLGTTGKLGVTPWGTGAE